MELLVVAFAAATTIRADAKHAKMIIITSDSVNARRDRTTVRKIDSFK